MANAYLNIVNSYGLKSSGINAIDVDSGVPVRVWNSNGTAIATVFASSKTSAESACNVLKNAASAVKLAKPRNNGTSITFTFGNSFKAVEQYQQFRDIIANNAAYFNVDQCPDCNMSGCDTVGLYKNNTAIKMHRACYEREKTSQLTNLNSFDGNFVTGILAALVCMIVWVFITALIRYHASYVIYPLYFGMPFAVGYAFKFGKGPYGTGGTICHFLISLVGVFLYVYLLGCMLATDYFGISLFTAIPYVSDILEIIVEAEILGDIALELILFIVGLVAVLVVNPTSKKLAAKNIADGDKLLVPIVPEGATFETYNPFGSTDTQNASSAYDAYNTQTLYGDQNAANTTNDWRDVYAQNSDNNNNNTFGN